MIVDRTTASTAYRWMRPNGVKPMKQMICNTMRDPLEGMLLEPEAVSAEVHSHLEHCSGCAAELTSLRRTMDLLDQWEAPEPNPYFMTRFVARLHEQQAAEPGGWLARMAALFWMGRVAHTRPLAAMSLTVLLLLGGGAYLDFADLNHLAQPDKQTAVIGDLETMDSNAQLLDRLESLSSEDGN